MNSVSEALNTLISAVNVAHNKGGVYSLEESHYVYLAIAYLNSLQNQEPKAESKSQPQNVGPEAIQPNYIDLESDDIG